MRYLLILFVAMLIAASLFIPTADDTAAATSCTSWLYNAYRSGNSWVVTGMARCSVPATLTVRVGSAATHRYVSLGTGTAVTTTTLYQSSCRTVSYSVGTNFGTSNFGYLVC